MPSRVPVPFQVFDADRVLAEFRHRFPRVPVWYGEYTGHWWALFRNRLIEAAEPASLGRTLDSLGARPRPRPAASQSTPQTSAAAEPMPASPRGHTSREVQSGRSGGRSGRHQRSGRLARLVGGLVEVREL